MRRRKKKMLKSRSGKKGHYPRNSKKFLQAGCDEDGMPIDVKMGTRKVHQVANKFDDGRYAWVDHAMIRRLLRKHVGKSWDEVWQAICSEYDPRTYEGYEVRSWMEFAVEQNCFIQDGEVVNEHGHKIGRWFDCFYVHPETGILHYIQPHRKWHREDEAQKVFEMDGVLYHEHEGLWYRVQMKELRKIERTRYVRNYRTGQINYRYKYQDWENPLREAFGMSDNWTSNTWSLTRELKTKYGLSTNDKYWYCVAKESANGKEIAKLRKKYKMDESAAA